MRNLLTSKASQFRTVPLCSDSALMSREQIRTDRKCKLCVHCDVSQFLGAHSEASDYRGSSEKLSYGFVLKKFQKGNFLT